MYFPGQQAASGATPGTGYQVEVVQGAIEDQQDDAIGCPMIGHDPLSSRIGKTLSNIIGKQLKETFDKETGKATLPGETVVVDGLPGLKCKAVIFLNLLCWDNKEQGSAAQALRQGIKRILAICKIRGYSSVALPVLGTGVLLRFPHKIASTILLEEIGVYGQNRTEKTSFRVRVIVYPKDKESSQAFKCAQGVLLQNGYISHVDLAEGSFYQCVSVIDDEITAMIGRVKLQLVCGDIVNAGTDVIVNTTNFTNLLTGVSKAILEAAGPAVHAELLQVGTPEDLICSTSAGQLGCKQIIHARFKGSTQRIRSTCKKILQLCESEGYGSVAFPAINTGQARMLFGESCKAMLDGMAVAIKEMNPDFVSLIRIVILEKQVFQAFKSELESRCQQDDVQSWFSFLAQQRVLQKPKHVVDVAGVTVELIVRDNPGPAPGDTSTPSDQSANPNLNASTTSPTQLSGIPPKLPPRSEEYELKLDSYLLRYLKESPKVKGELDSQLALLSCTAELQPQEERVLVWRVAQPGAAAEPNDWKSEVNQLFDVFTCHYEMDAHKVKALLQSYSSHQPADEVKVYSDVGMTVVVGERSQVEAKLRDLESLYVKNKGSRPSDVQTTVRRIGEAKLRLLWKEIESSLGQDFPALKVTQADEGKIALMGSVEEILKAGEVISEKEKLVLERTITDKSLQFLAFLKNVYGGPGMLCEFLGVAKTVEAEIRDTALHFFSFSADNLDESVKMIQKNFNDVTYDIPNYPVLPPALCVALKSKANEINQTQCRANVGFGAGGTVCLSGHSAEVDELSEIVSQFILDQVSVEGKVTLPFPELCPLLTEFLQRQRFDYSGVTFTPVTPSSSPMVLLVGPSIKVTEVRNRLGPLLQSVVLNKVTIDLPGAGRYFSGHSGRDMLLKVAESQKCLIQPEEQPHLSRPMTRLSKYNLQHGLQVIVYQGDITKQNADGIVNAANEDLNHIGGVAAALSKAGGPQVQKESRALVKGHGKIAVGDVVVTTGGDLKCKSLLHAVGPESGRASGRERSLLEKTVSNALKLAELMEFKSIALPCISSGIFAVPIKVCSEAIVTAIKEFGSQDGRSLSKIILIDKREEVVRAMQDACDRLLPGKDLGFKTNVADQEGASGATAETPVQVEIVKGTIEDQQADAIVSPMIGHDPVSTRIGNILQTNVGPQLEALFYQEARGATLPSDIVVVESVPVVKCKAVIFLNLQCWDNKQDGPAIGMLRQGIRKILNACSNRGYSSVAIPVLGTGALLKFPHNVASRILLEEVGAFERKRTSGSPFLIRIVVHPTDRESNKALQSAQASLHLRGFTNDVDPTQASFYRHVSMGKDEVVAMMGAVKLQIIHGDIIAAGTDVIVNTTDFVDYQSGVSHAILAAAGPAVLAELTRVGTPPDHFCTTQPGLLGCKEIVHASFKADSDVIHKNCKKILRLCESKGFSSVAFPAVNTGRGKMSPKVAATAMLDGLASTIRDMNPTSLSVIRIVILQQPVFQGFRSELENRFGRIVQSKLSLRDKARQRLKKIQEKCSRLTTFSSKQDETISSKPESTVLRVISCGPDVAKNVKKELELIVQKELIERTVPVHRVSKLDAMELEAVQAKVKLTGISVEHKAVDTGRPMGRTGSSKKEYVLKGLKEDVLSVTELITKAVQKVLEEELKDKEEAMLALNIQWAMKDDSGEWQELSLSMNYMLEEAHLQKKVCVDLETPEGKTLNVNMKSQDATDWTTGTTYKLKRTECKDLELPSHWEPMQDEVFKKVELQPNSNEYQNVASDFLKTAKYTIHKIERVQNLYLWNAYSLCRQRILAKNGQAELGEKSLYHGTSAESCSCIERDRFDRSYAGAHATAYGRGVYFAVHAEYSAKGFSPPDQSGMKRLYVARVVTGRYTLGSSSMRAPPARGADPTDCFDSLVNNRQQPTMFIVFHDDQAYPEYLITFR